MVAPVAMAAMVEANAINTNCQNEPATLDDIPERYQEQQAGRITELGQHGDQGWRIGREILRHHRQHGLVVIDVGDRQTAGEGHGKDKGGAGRAARHGGPLGGD